MCVYTTRRTIDMSNARDTYRFLIIHTNPRYTIPQQMALSITIYFSIKTSIPVSSCRGRPFMRVTSVSMSFARPRNPHSRSCSEQSLFLLGSVFDWLLLGLAGSADTDSSSEPSGRGSFSSSISSRTRTIVFDTPAASGGGMKYRNGSCLNIEPRRVASHKEPHFVSPLRRRRTNL